ncbi:Vacuolar amino acid transporter 2 [Diplonema papillatum]|nr:Vacuolar amino acid transporter 2 [Diplonema papillatum]
MGNVLPGMAAHLERSIENQGQDLRPLAASRAVVVGNVTSDDTTAVEKAMAEVFDAFGDVESISHRLNGEEHEYDVVFTTAHPVQEALSAGGVVVYGHSATVFQRERRTTVIQGRFMSMASAILNLLNAIVGSGVLGLAFIMKGSGVALCTTLTVIMVFIVHYSLQMLLAAAMKSRVDGVMISYERLGHLAWGEKGRILISSMIVMQNTGAMISYLKVFKDVIHKIMELLVSSDSLLANSSFLTAMATILVFFPACSTKIGFLAYVGFVAIILTVFFVSFVVVKSQLLADHQTCQDECDIHYGFSPTLDTFLAIPTLCFSFVCHTAVLPVYHELHTADSIGRTRRSKSRIIYVVHAALMSAFTLYFCGALFGYLTFGGKTNQDLLTNYENAEPNAPLSVTVRLLFVSAVLCSVPLLIFPCRRSLGHLYEAICNLTGHPIAPPKTGVAFWIQHCFITAAILAVMLLGALFVPHITTVFGAVGSTSSVALVFLLPSALYMKICGSEDVDDDMEKVAIQAQNDDDMDDNSFPIPLHVYGPRIMFGLGAVIFVVSWVGLIITWST